MSRLPAEGALWVNKILKLYDVIVVFKDERHELIIKGKGVIPSSLGEPWGELARVIQNYTTCDGQIDVIRSHQLKLLVVLKQKCSVNLPAYLNFLLHDTNYRIKKSQCIETVMSHHCLIRLIVSYNLAQQQSILEELIFSIEGAFSLPTPNHVLKRRGIPLQQIFPKITKILLG